MLRVHCRNLIKSSVYFFRIHTIPSVPIVDCFNKIRQQVKCYLQMAGMMGKNELQEVLKYDNDLYKCIRNIASTYF